MVPGALQTLFLKEGPLGPGLSLLQRLFFFPLDWLVQYPVRLLGIIVPIVFLWTGVGPFIITSLDEMLSYQLPAFIALGWTMRFFAPNCYVPILSTAISFFSSLRLVPTALSTLIKPFGAPFRVTPKGSNNAASSVDRYALFVVGLLAALTLVGMVVNWISPDWLEGGRAGLVVAEIYALFNLVILALAGAMALEVPRPRRGERFPVHHHGSYDLGDEEGDFPCVLLTSPRPALFWAMCARSLRAHRSIWTSPASASFPRKLSAAPSPTSPSNSLVLPRLSV